MLFHSSIRRELARSFGATLLVLFTIAITILLIRTLSMANRGKVNPQEIMLMLTYTVVSQLPMILTMALFIAIVSTLSRMYRDSEMAIWFSSGQGLTSFLAPVARVAWPVWLAMALLAFFAWPWAKLESMKLSDRYERRGDLERVTPGQFQESANGRRVFFIDKDSKDSKDGSNVFISATEPSGNQTITTASRGRVEWVGDDQFLVLQDGQRLEQSPQNPKASLKIAEFEEYRIQIGQAKDASTMAQEIKAVPTLDLLKQNDSISRGELAVRIGQVLAGLNFALLAVAVTGGNARSSKSTHLAFMLLSFVVYTNVGVLGQNWIATGKVNWLGFLLALHGGVFLLTAGWLAKRHYNVRLLPQWPAHKGAAV